MYLNVFLNKRGNKKYFKIISYNCKDSSTSLILYERLGSYYVCKNTVLPKIKY